MIPSSAKSRFTAWFGEFWFLLPLWIFILNAISIFDAQVRSPSPTQRGLAWTILFPLSAALIAYLFRAEAKYRKEKGRILLSIFSFIVFLAGLMAISLVRRGVPYGEVDVSLSFEISTGLAFFLYLIHGFHYEGMDKSAAFFIIGLLYGIILENGGILLGFFREEGYRLYLPFLPAPFFTTLGWCNVFYSCRFLARLIHRENEKSRGNNGGRVGGEIRGEGDKRIGKIRESISFAGTLSLFALFLDLQLDPYATHHRLWVWHESLKPFFGEVPLVNFSAWVSAIFPFAFLFRLLERRGSLERERKRAEGPLSFRLLVLIPVILLLAILLVLSITLLLEGASSPAMEIFLQRLLPFVD